MLHFLRGVTRRVCFSTPDKLQQKSRKRRTQQQKKGETYMQALSCASSETFDRIFLPIARDAYRPLAAAHPYLRAGFAVPAPNILVGEPLAVRIAVGRGAHQGVFCLDRLIKRRVF
jgi:hypothetical protein